MARTKDIEILVNRYNEDISWIEPYLKHTTIYNKGNDDLTYPCINLPNIGRESHTWIYHMYTNYDTLPNYLICLQGDPNPHFFGKTTKFLDKFINKETRNEIEVEDIDYIPLTDWYVTESIIDGVSPIRGIYDFYIKLFDKMPDFETYEYANSGQFCVSKKRIKKYPKSFYEKYLELVLNSNNNDFYNFAHTVERFWTLMFSN
jgi:hypothetical protein